MEQNDTRASCFDVTMICKILIRAIIISLFILLAWFFWFTIGSELGARLYASWFGLTRSEFVLLNLAGLLAFKMACIVFFLIPFAAIKLSMKK